MRILVFKRYFILAYVYMSMWEPVEARRGFWPSGAGMTGDWLKWVLGTELRPSGRSANNLNPWVISPAPRYIFSSTPTNHSKGQQQNFLLVILDFIPTFLPVKAFSAKLPLVVVMVVLETELKALHKLGKYLTLNPCPQFPLYLWFCYRVSLHCPGLPWTHSVT